MSDRIWYLFGETLKAEFKEMAKCKNTWFQCEKELAEKGLHSDGNEDFKTEYWEAHLDGYLDFCRDAITRIDRLYEKIGGKR